MNVIVIDLYRAINICFCYGIIIENRGLAPMFLIMLRAQ